MRLGRSLSLLGVLAAVAMPAQAQQYPSRPVTVVVPFAAGGAGPEPALSGGVT